MAKSKKRTPKQENEDVLAFEKAQELTVGEAKRKSEELEAGITASDNVLDRYIKKHRDEVSAQKFETKTQNFEDMNLDELDAFIAKQKEKLDEVSEVVEKTVATAPVKPTPLTAESDDVLSRDDEFALDDRPFLKTKRGVLTTLTFLALGIAGTVYGVNYWSKWQNKPTTTVSSTSSSSKDTSKKDYTAFTELYGTFFVDDQQTQLKNSSFDSFSELEKALASLKNTDYYAKASQQVETLKRGIEAIKSVNGLFETDAIVDGHKMVATLKEGASVDSLSTDVLNTGNATLDALLQQVLTEARQKGATTGTAIDSEAKSTKGDTGTTSSSSTVSSSAPSSPGLGSAGTTVTQATAPVSYGITGYDPATLQRHLSRVPYNDSALADSSNSAWHFNPGILEGILATSRQRGYIVGNDFILERVNIINGNGYYNLFKPDGTYLFSMNAKTGYFVGNAKGNADSLDY